jgi:hypothetical protein
MAITVARGGGGAIREEVASVETYLTHDPMAAFLVEVAFAPAAVQLRTRGEVCPQARRPVQQLQGTTVPTAAPDAVIVKRFAPYVTGSHTYEHTG